MAIVGGKREGAGRPKGSKNIHSQDSVKKLEALGFDPIEMMAKKYHEISATLEATYKTKEGETRKVVREGSGAYAQLVATQGQLINNLMQYGYRKVPEKQELEATIIEPLQINLNLPTKSDENKKEE